MTDNLNQQIKSTYDNNTSPSRSLTAGWTRTDIAAIVRRMSEGLLFSLLLYGLFFSLSSAFLYLLMFGMLLGTLVATIIATDLPNISPYISRLFLGASVIITIILASLLVDSRVNFLVPLARFTSGKELASLGVLGSIAYISLVLISLVSLILTPIIAIAGLVWKTECFNREQWLPNSVIWTGIFTFLLSVTIGIWLELAEPIIYIVGLVGMLAGAMWSIPYMAAMSRQQVNLQNFEQREKLLSSKIGNLERVTSDILNWLPLVFRANASSHMWINAIAEIETNLNQLRLHYPDSRVDLVLARFYYEIGRVKDAERKVRRLLRGSGLDANLRKETESFLQEIQGGTISSWVDRFFEQCDYELLILSSETVRIFTPEAEHFKRHGTLVVNLLEGKRVVTHRDVRDLLQLASNVKGHQQECHLGVIVVAPDAQISPEARAQQQLLLVAPEKERFVALFLKFDDIRKAVAERTASKLLRDAIYEATEDDPFELEDPVSNRGDFFGRSREIRKIRAHLNYGRAVVLTGIRRIGKTSLMNMLQDTPEESGWFVVNIDLQSLKPLTRGAFYAAITQSLEQQISDRFDPNKLGKPFPKFTLDGDSYLRPEVDFLEDINRLRRFLKMINAEGRIVVMLDEVGELVSRTGTSDTDSLGELVTVAKIFPSLLLSTPYPNVRSAVFRQFEASILPMSSFPLSVFSKVECDQMINNLGGTRGMLFTEGALDLIYSVSGGHPYIVRQLCSIIYQKWGASRQLEKIDKEDVGKAAHEYLKDETRTHYFKHTLWRRQFSAQPSYREILDHMARKPGCTLDYLQQKLSGVSNRDDIRDALNQLSEYGIIKQIRDKYYISIKLFEQWLVRIRTKV